MKGTDMNCLKLTFGVVCAIVVLSIGGGCKKKNSADTELGKTQPVPEAKDESGWPVYQVASEGFSLSLPPDWRQIDLDPAKWENTTKDLGEKNPQLKSMFSGVRQQIGNGIKFFGFDQNSASTGFATNINVIRVPVPAGITLDALIEQSKAQYQVLPGVQKPIEQSRVKSKAGDCARFQVTMVMNGPNNTQFKFTTTQFVFLKDDKCFTVSIATKPESVSKYISTIDHIAQSFQFTN